MQRDHYNPKIIKLGPVRLKETIDSNFSSIYMTLLSIIQSVSLGFLAVEFLENHQSYELVNFLLFGVTFLTIVTVWHTYLLGCLLLRWHLTIVDSLLPFSIGFTECLLVRSVLNESLWFLLLSIVFILAFFTNVNAFFHKKPEDFVSIDIYQQSRKNSIHGMKIRGTLGFFVIPSFFIFVLTWPEYTLFPTIIVVAIGLYHILVLFRKISID